MKTANILNIFFSVHGSVTPEMNNFQGVENKAHTAQEKDAQRCHGFTRNLGQITNGP